MPTTTPSPNLLPAATTMDAVTLHVRDVDAMVTFYTHVIGLTVLHSDNSTSTARDQRPGVYTLGHETTPIVVLRHTPDLPAAHPGQAGLFHTAILYPTQHDLGDTPQAASVSAASVGHVHLQVGDTNAAAQFYSQALGFEPTAQVPGALFVAAGGYHHHNGAALIFHDPWNNSLAVTATDN